MRDRLKSVGNPKAGRERRQNANAETRQDSPRFLLTEVFGRSMGT
jgi:hypothetical protein